MPLVEYTPGSRVHGMFTRLLSVWTQRAILTIYWPYSEHRAKVTKLDCVATGICRNGRFYTLFSVKHRNVRFYTLLHSTSIKWVSGSGVWVYFLKMKDKKTVNSAKQWQKRRCVITVLHLFWQNTRNDTVLLQLNQPRPSKHQSKGHFSTFQTGSQFFPGPEMHLLQNRAKPLMKCRHG